MALLEVKNINKSFGKHEVLKGIDFSLEKGEVLSIIGSSGSGKTTLLRCINFLEFADKGTITVGGETIYNGETDKKLKEKELRSKRLHFGLVFQDFNLFSQYSVLQNLMLAPTLAKMDTKENLEKRARQIIERVNLTDKTDFYPCQLSGGQKQRVAIAGILAIQPKCIVLDEPTAMLDPSGRNEVMSTLLKLNKEDGITVVLITHYMDEAVLADRVVVMDSGKVLTEGTPDEVFSEVERLKKHRLDVPQAAELAYRLRGCGVKIDRIPLKREDCVKLLEEAIK